MRKQGAGCPDIFSLALRGYESNRELPRKFAHHLWAKCELSFLLVTACPSPRVDSRMVCARVGLRNVSTNRGTRRRRCDEHVFTCISLCYLVCASFSLVDMHMCTQAPSLADILRFVHIKSDTLESLSLQDLLLQRQSSTPSCTYLQTPQTLTPNNIVTEYGNSGSPPTTTTTARRRDHQPSKEIARRAILEARQSPHQI